MAKAASAGNQAESPDTPDIAAPRAANETRFMYELAHARRDRIKLKRLEIA
jgi:hypothetical protein